MSEFLNRIDLQREVIKIVNEGKQKFKISGLSIKAIEKWQNENQVSSNSEILNVLKIISGKLYFLSNKSQEQITEDYQNLSREVTLYLGNLKHLIKAENC